jgi:IS1 family transposase
MSNPTPDPAPVPPCPRGADTHVVRNGTNDSGSQTYRCRGCGRRFVADPKKGPVTDDEQALVRRLLAERMGVRAIARATGRSRTWVQGFVNAVYRDETPHDPGPPPKKSGPVVIEAEADELWSFVGSKADVHWVWVVLDADTRRVLAMVVGDRSADTARRLWDALPAECRDGAVVYTDFLASYQGVIPESQHRAVGKESGRTAHIERFWLTLRQRCARFVRKTLSYSKCPRNHLGALWYFIRLYNLCHA